MTTPSDDILDLLTAYALDALEPEEISRVHALLAKHPELRLTLAELRATADTLPYGLPEANPAPELRQRVLDYATGRSSQRPAAVLPPSRQKRSGLFALGGLLAAAVVAAVAGWGQTATLRNQLEQTNAQLAQSRIELEQVQIDLNATREDLATAQVVLASLHGDSGQGSVVRTSDGGTVFMVKLPQLEPGRTYQLWRMSNNIAPLSAGLFSVDQQGFGTFTLDQQPQDGEIVGVTNEPQGGSPGPTGVPLIQGPVQSS